MKHTTLYVFDGSTDELLTTLSNKGSKRLTFSSDEIIEQLNKDYTFDITVPMNHKDSKYMVDGNRIVFKDLDGEFQEFQIYKTVEEHGSDESSIVVSAEHSIYEINDDVVEDLRVVNGEASVALEKALSASRFEVGNVDSLGLGTVNFYYSTGMANLQDIQKEYGGEFKYRVTLNSKNTKIEHRYVDLLVRRGADTNKRYEYTKDIRSLKRTISRDGIKTALYGRGKGEELDDSNGYSRKVTFEFIEWKKSNGDPMDKPYGQKWLGDPDALKQFGRLNKDGTLRHRFYTFDVDSTDPKEILQKTYEQLMEINKPQYTIEVEGQDLEIVGLKHEAVRLGDTVFIIDKTFNPVLRVEARIIEIRRSLSDPENIKVTLGNFIPLSTDIAVELDKLKADFTDRKGVWDKVDDIEVGDLTDSNIADILPNTPTGFEATGLFKSIAVEWDFEPSLYIATYEVYGSKVKGFTVDSSNLLFRGKTGGYVHKAQTNETWYFRIRAVNTHGRKSQLSSEISGSTIRIETADYEDLSIVNAKIADLSVDASKMAKATITDAEIKSLNVDKVIAGRLKAKFVEIGSTTTYADGYDPSKKASEQDIIDYTKPVFEGTYDPNFSSGTRFWGTIQTGKDSKTTTKGVIVPSNESVEGGNVWQVNDDDNYYSLNAIPVNTSRVYQVTARVRQKTNPTTGGSGVLIGVAPLDENYNRIEGGAGYHRYCASYDSATGSTVMTLTEADGWQTITGLISGEGDTHNEFRVGTKYVRPVIVANFDDGNGIVEIGLMDFKDVTEVQELRQTLDEVSLRTEEDKIIATVRASAEYESDLLAKANADDLQGYATTDDLDQAKTNLEGSMDEKIGAIDFSPYATKTEVETTAEALDTKFSSSGGVNLIKNSVGFAGTDFWEVNFDKDSYGVIIGSIDTRQDGTIQEKGSGSAFVLQGARLDQSFSINADNITLSAVVKKPAGVYGRITVIYDDDQKVTRGFGSTAEYDYEKIQLNISPKSSNMTVEIYGGKEDELIVTSLMVNVGNVPLQWQHSSGEVYNTNVLMDLNGIRVLSNQYNGYTSITPEEFSGYAEVEGEMKRVFTLNKDTTEMEKAKARSEISMSPIKIVPVQSSVYNGWAFIKDEG
jgi:phage minor structural protein